MSLYGALFGGVSGLRAQSSKIGVISDNIANVNTVGYKQGAATFKTLVVNSNAAASYQTGGVLGGTRLSITKQGLLQSTESATDIAISGGGFFVVKSVANTETTSQPLYTRAGSFAPDELGNFKNTQGFYLQGWPLDREGRLPGETGNLNTTSFTNFDSLETVNVQSASGIAQATSNISLKANLKAGEVIFPGQAGVLKPDTNNASNMNLASDAILAGSDYGMATSNSTARGDRFTVSTGGGLQYTYEYGGFTIGRNALVASNNAGDGTTDNQSLINLGAAADIEFSGGSSFTINIPNHGLITGDEITLAGFGGTIGATPAAELNGTHTVQRISDSELLITVATPHGGGTGVNAGPGGITADTRQFQGNILDAVSTTQTFLGITGTTDYTNSALTFTVTTPASGTVTFKYTTTSPSTQNGEFNNLTTLASAINAVTGLTARVSNGRLMVGAEDATQAVTFANGDAVGDATHRGIDWVGELGIANVDAGNRRYSSLQGLANLVTTDEGVSASITSATSNAVLNIRVDDPLDTITFSDLGVPATSISTVGNPIAVPAGTYTPATGIDVVITDAAAVASLLNKNVNLQGLAGGLGGLPGTLPNGGPFQVTSVNPGVSYTIHIPLAQTITTAGGAFPAAAGNSVAIVGESNHGSQLAQLGLVTSLNGGAYTPQTTGVLGPEYDPTGAIGDNMASGKITAQFSRNVRIYDSLGSGHDVRFSFIKTAQNTWAVEIHAIPESEVNTPLVNGQIATGSITFNGDGSLRSVSASLSGDISIGWRNGAEPSNITLGLGTAGQPFGTEGAAVIGLTDGLSQFDSGYKVDFANQNGAPVGELVSVSIDENGVVIASYSNGETQSLYKIPLAEFANPDGLNPQSGNVYTQTNDSGEVNLREANTSGVGTFVSSALEQSNVDLAEQLTDMIVAQRAYQANTRVIKTTDELLEQLNQL
jgi:flagellar hook protein FlgE